MTELGDLEDTHTGTPQGGILSPLLANIALTALDEHLMGPWKPGGEHPSTGAPLDGPKGLPTWRLVRYADDLSSWSTATDTTSRLVVRSHTLHVSEPRYDRGSRGVLALDEQAC
jgi:hypothetical protein